jgi:calcium permeable stress-gated cation channel
MMRTIFSLVALLTCAILVPINVSYNLKFVPKDSRDALSMLTIRDVGGNYLWAHVGMVYIITAAVIVVVWFHWTAMVRLREQFFRSPEYALSFYARTLIVMRVPKKLQSDPGIQNIFDSVQVPYPTTAVHIGRRVGDLPHLIEVHNNTVRQFEQVLVHYLKGGKIGKKRPSIRLGGFWGMGGVVRDAIDYYTCVAQQHSHGSGD